MSYSSFKEFYRITYRSTPINAAEPYTILVAWYLRCWLTRSSAKTTGGCLRCLLLATVLPGWVTLFLRKTNRPRLNTLYTA